MAGQRGHVKDNTIQASNLKGAAANSNGAHLKVLVGEERDPRKTPEEEIERAGREK